MTLPHYRAALLQMRVEGGDLSGNLSRAESGIAQAAAGSARLAVLPEAMDLGWTHPSCRNLAGEVPGGHAANRLCAAAARHGLYVCAGLTERAGERIFNSAVLISPGGNVLLKHRKINELSIAHDCYALGDGLNVVDTELGRLGLMICADAFAPGQALSRALGCMGAQLILSPSAWAVPAEHDQAREPYGSLWREHYTPVARDFSLWIIGVSNVGPITGGPWAGRKCIGCSLVIDPGGREVLQGPYGELADAVLWVDVTLPDHRRRSCDL
jgi:predicted amidohydrolase